MISYIAFGHEKYVGKDTAAKFAATILRLELGYKDVRYAGFSDKLKDHCYELFSWADLKPGDFYEEPGNQYLKDVILPKINMTPRQIWIGHGQGARQGYSKVWIDYLLHSNKTAILLIKDLRFPEEAEAIKSNNGLVIKIIRPSIAHTSDAADDPLLNYKGWNDELLNDGTIEQFMNKIRNLLKHYFEG